MFFAALRFPAGCRWQAVSLRSAVSSVVECLVGANASAPSVRAKVPASLLTSHHSRSPPASLSEALRAGPSLVVSLSHGLKVFLVAVRAGVVHV